MSNLDKIIKSLVDTNGVTNGSQKQNKNRKIKNKNKNRALRSQSMIETRRIVAPISGSVVSKRVGTPNLVSIGEGACMCNSELVTTITTAAAGAFSAFSVAIAPLSAGWFNSNATNFSQWQLHNLRIVFVPSCSTTTPGSIVMSTSFDHVDVNPVSQGNASAAYHAVTSPVWGGYEGAHLLNDFSFAKPNNGVSMLIDTTKFSKQRYPYTNATAFNLLSTADRNVFSPGKIFISTEGGPTTATVVGSVYFVYRVSLLQPIVSSQNG